MCRRRHGVGRPRADASMDLAVGAIQRLHRAFPGSRERVLAGRLREPGALRLRQSSGNCGRPFAGIVPVAHRAGLTGHHVFPRTSASGDDDGKTAGLCFQDDIACRVRGARKHEAVGRCKRLGDGLPGQRACEHRVRQCVAQCREQRTIADHNASVFDTECCTGDRRWPEGAGGPSPATRARHTAVPDVDPRRATSRAAPANASPVRTSVVSTPRGHTSIRSGFDFAEMSN